MDPNDPEVIKAAHEAGISEAFLKAAKKSPVYKLAKEWALHCHCIQSIAHYLWFGMCLPLNNLQRVTSDVYLPDAHEMRACTILS